MNNFEFIANNNSVLAQKLAHSLGHHLHDIEVNHFADSETYINLNDVAKLEKLKNLFVLNQFYFSTIGFSSINNQMFNFLFLINLLKKIGAENIVAFLPYLPYSRQDKMSLILVQSLSRDRDSKDLGSIDLVSKFLKTAGINKLITCEMHNTEIIKDLDLEIENIDFSPFWFEFLKSDVFTSLIENDFSKVCFVAPDKGAKLRNQKLSDNFGSKLAFVEKTRVAPDSPVAMNLDGDVKDKIVIMVDDIIDTGKTAIKACELILKNGAKKVIGCFTHAVLSPGAVKRIDTSLFDRVFITDTILIDRNSLSKKFFIVSVDKFLESYFKKL
ncbi:MAG: ribose-phosphate diphosphokinase [bacterium]